MVDIRNTLSELAKERPIFHSEADFQHALAWKIHEGCGSCCVRLEYPPPGVVNRVHLDVWVKHEGATIVIELKYRTAELKTQCHGERFDLKPHSAPDLGRYGFIEDVQRLESIVQNYGADAVGYAVLLTNDHLYWLPPRKKLPNDRQFRVHEGRTIAGTLRWQEDAEDPVVLSGRYGLRWEDYSSSAKNKKNGQFKYLLVTVGVGGR